MRERESVAVPKLLIAATTDAEMRYASGLAVTDPFILLDTGRRRHILVSSLEYGRVRKELLHKKKVKAVLFDKYYETLKKRIERKQKGGKVKRGSLLALIATAYLKELRIRRVMVPQNAWASHVEQLRKEGIRVEVSQRPLYPERAVKTKKELREILKVRNAAAAAMGRCLTIIKESKANAKRELIYGGRKVTSELLRYEARRTLLERACEAPELIISHGRQTAYPHENGRGVIRTGEPIILDFFPRGAESGYWFDMTRTVCKGMPSSELKKLYDAVKEAQDAALKLIKPGMRTGRIHAAAEEVFARRGYATTAEEGFIHGTGHGVGLEIHEAPSLGKEGKDVLRRGNILTVEPGLYYRKVGGVRLENTVLVTTTGYKDLTRMGRVLLL